MEFINLEIIVSILLVAIIALISFVIQLGFENAFYEKKYKEENGKLPKINFFGHIARLFCNHDYNLINETEIKSDYDIIVESGKTPNTWNSRRRIYVWDYKCSKCGKIKRLKLKTAK